MKGFRRSSTCKKYGWGKILRSEGPARLPDERCGALLTVKSLKEDPA